MLLAGIQEHATRKPNSKIERKYAVRPPRFPVKEHETQNRLARNADDPEGLR